MPHDRRERFKDKPVHVTLRVVPGQMGLRHGAESKAVLTALEAGGQGRGFHLVHYSIQWDHLHLIIEASDEVALAVGMKGLCVRIARALNRLWKRTGQVLADRYHAHVVRSYLEMRNVLRYVLLNGRKHGVHMAPGPDPLSSGAAYRAWSDRSPELAIPDPRIAEPHTWILAHGMPSEYPPIATDELPFQPTSPCIFATLRKAERRRRRAS